MCLQLSLWINEKMLTAQDMSYDEARNLHSKWLKHQAFMAELQSNKEWLDKIDKVGHLRGRLQTSRRPLVMMSSRCSDSNEEKIFLINIFLCSVKINHRLENKIRQKTKLKLQLETHVSLRTDRRGQRQALIGLTSVPQFFQLQL